MLICILRGYEYDIKVVCFWRIVGMLVVVVEMEGSDRRERFILRPVLLIYPPASIPERCHLGSIIEAWGILTWQIRCWVLLVLGPLREGFSCPSCAVAIPKSASVYLKHDRDGTSSRTFRQV